MLIQGLPRSTQVAVAEPGPTTGTPHCSDSTAAVPAGLADPAVGAAGGSGGRGRAEEPANVLAMPGAGSGSALDQWSGELAAGQVTPSGADVLWRRVQQMFDDPAIGVGDSLIDTLMLPDGRQVPAAQFGDGMTEHRTGAAAPFDASLFTHAAQTTSSSAVAIDEGMVARRGLGYRAVVIQASEGLPAYDFAVFAPPQPTAPIDNEVPPGSGDLVF